MTTYSTPGMLLALSAGFAGLLAPVAEVAPTTRAAASSSVRTGDLAWQSCARPGGPQQQECARLTVPLDHRDPDGRQISLAVSRLVSDRPESRRGTLVVIPGGPGGSGVQRLAQRGAALQREVKGAYDLVALDPRGAGGSTGAGCGLTEDDRRFHHLARAWPGPDGSIDANVARARRVADACARDGGPVLRSMSTANEVRDIESFREALGVAKLSAWGTSYGAYVAAVYAQHHPHRIDRWVLDSNGDPDPRRVGRGWLANLGRGVEDRFPDFAAWAAHPDRGALRVAERPEQVRPTFLALAGALDAAPRDTAAGDVQLTGNLLRLHLQLALSGPEAEFAELARVIRAVQEDRVPELPAELTAVWGQEEAAAMIATVCNDVEFPGRVEDYRRAVAADRAARPLTAGQPENIVACAFWRERPVDAPTRITDRGPSRVLMVQNLRDPATPYAGALRMRRALGERARMVSVDAGGHGAYLTTGNSCADRTVTAFLTTGVRPSTDVRCPREP
ncbi:alpha/beta hydrolase [Streptomyces sp. NPDC049906]|uniref:alpha/beta hydrolase n=1 Tax=Streptomyces sp. NPDC049906 TaxID=3155656 RepID=UPI003415663E